MRDIVQCRMFESGITSTFVDTQTLKCRSCERAKIFFKTGTHLSASLPGSLAASDALGSARSGFEATPVIDADHGVSES